MKQILSLLLILLTLSCSENRQPVQTAFSEAEKPAPQSLKEESRSNFALSADVDLTDNLAGMSSTVVAKRKGIHAPQNSLSSLFYSESDFARERYLAYTISLSFVSHDFDHSRTVLMRVLEQHGFPVNSSLSIQNNRYYQRSTIKVKTDSLYIALKELKEMGILISENITVKDYTNSVRTSPMVNNRDTAETQRRDVSSINNISIRDQVEWSTISLDIRGTEEVYPEQKKSSLAANVLSDIRIQFSDLIRFISRNLIVLTLLGGAILLLRKAALRLKRDK